MPRYDKYLWYVLKHKWFVMLECFKRGLFWRGLTHDLSKFRPSEFIPYARYFYGKESTEVEEWFDFAWLLHQKRNDHHWQWWILTMDDGGFKALPMSCLSRLEMTCDWTGAGKAQKSSLACIEWYRENKHKMVLHEQTRVSLHSDLGLFLEE